MTVLVRAASLQGYPELAQQCGVDPRAAMRRVRLSMRNLEDVDSLIPYTALINLLEQTAAESGCLDFGLRLARQQGIGVLGQLAMLFQHAQTLGDALQPAVFRLVVAFVLVCQAAFRKLCCSVDFGVLGLRWTSLIGLQLRAAPDQRLGFAWRAAA